MRISDWSSDVCSSDLSIVTYGMALWAFSLGPTAPLAALRETGMVTALAISVLFLGERVTPGRIAGVLGILAGATLILTIGRAPLRERVRQYVFIAVGAGYLKTKHDTLITNKT